MKVYISIRVRNSEWYWSKKEMKEHGDYRPDFEMIHEDKIQKHILTVEFDFNFEISGYNESATNSYNLEIYRVNNEQIDNNPIYFQLKDVRVLNFNGPEGKCSVVISNRLIHQHIGNKKQNGKRYFYFYIKEDSDWVRVDQHIWVDKTELDRIFYKYGEFMVKPDKRVRIISITNQL